MAATITLTTAARNAAADAIVGQMGTAAVLTIATAAFASTLATIALSNPAYGASSGGVATMSGTPLQDTSADNTGTAAVWRIRTSGAQTVLSGTLATTATGADITLDDVARNAAVNAIVDLIDVGGAGDIQFTTSGDTTFASVLITIPTAATAFGSAASGAAALAGPISGAATAAGTAALFRFRNHAGTEVFRGTVGTAGEDINFSAGNVFGVGATITLTSYTFNMAATSAASVGLIVINNLSITAGEVVEITSGSFTQPA
jgi:hypothetical protein